MTNEEALEDFRRFIDTKTTMRPSFFANVVIALENRIPKGPRWDAGHPYCKVCEARLRHSWVVGRIIGDDFCGNCGQAIDWSGEYDK